MVVLLIEDDVQMVKNIKSVLSAEGIKCNSTSRGEEGLQILRLQSHDVILVDLSLPGMTGFEFIDTLRKSKIQIPIIVISGITEVTDKVRVLSLGADDYVTKPIDAQELLARIKRHVFRSQNHANAEVITGDLKINLDTKCVTIKDRVVKLTFKEYSLLEILALKKGLVVFKNIILRHLYQDEEEADKKIIDVIVCKLRSKFADYSEQNFIETIWGMGYCLTLIDNTAQAKNEGNTDASATKK